MWRDVFWHLVWTFCHEGRMRWNFLQTATSKASLAAWMSLCPYFFTHIACKKKSLKTCLASLSSQMFWPSWRWNILFSLTCLQGGSEIKPGPRQHDMFEGHKYGRWLEDNLFSCSAACCWDLTVLLLFLLRSAARKVDPRARGRATPATGEREASPGSDRRVRAGTSADGFAAAAVLQVRTPEADVTSWSESSHRSHVRQKTKKKNQPS